MKTCLLIGLVLAMITIFGCAQTPSATAANPVVVMETSEGTIKIELYPDKAPKTVANFLKYAEDKHYDGTIFHRVIGNFMIQGGGFNPDMSEKDTRAPIPLEVGKGLSNTRGTIAMARTNDPNSATSQFFINVEDNARGLDPRPGSEGYAVFGKVTEGMDVVDKIKKVETGNKGFHQDVPLKPVTIKSVRKEGS